VDTVWFNKVAFFDSLDGLAIGADIYKTVDAGFTWEGVNLTDNFFSDIAVLDDSTCLVSGSPDRLMRSTDRGETWTVLFEEESELYFGQLSFLNEEIGFATITSGGALTSIGKTINGGLDWEIIEREDDNIQPTVLETFEFISENEGFFGGWYLSQLMRTTDEGVNWSSVAIDTLGGVLTPGIRDFHIPSDQPTSFYASCWGGRIYKSINGGLNWYELNTGLSSDIQVNGIYFLDGETGWAVGSAGSIIRTFNGG
jgi:photosystem II stability/assembly factor-like uncharacterized protein